MMKQRTTTRTRLPACIVLILVIRSASPDARADDWPMWRYDANRSAACPQKLAPQLYLRWIRHYPRLQPAWPGETWQQFDGIYQPVVMGKKLFVGSSRNDSLTALHTDTGRQALAIGALFIVGNR